MNALEITDLQVRYGHVQALHRLTLHVGEGEIVAVLGNNGAGKTTTLSTVSGVIGAFGGSVSAFGKDITTAKPWDVVAAGIIHVPEGRRIFSRLSVQENLQMGGYLVDDKRLIASRIEQVYSLLPRLHERRTQQGGTLSGGEQQMLAVGRALIAGPKLIMLDEPSMGLAPLIAAAIMDVIKSVSDSGTSVLLVEQNARAALKIANRAYVIDTGKVSLEGTAAELSGDPRVVDAYLGT